MNREQVFVAFRKMAERDSHYFDFGRTGVIEEMLAYFGLAAKPFKGVSFVVHEDNLQILYDFMMQSASDEQICLIYEVATGHKSIPIMNSCLVSSGKVFVSMPMNKDKYGQLVDDIRAGIDAGVSATSNSVYFLDLDVYNGNITAKLLEEIQSCKFLVADFTTQNSGVYYEAGYASALGKTVIHTCQCGDFDNVHFDIKQTQFVRWSDKDDLAKRLQHQIECSGLAVK